MKSSTLSIIAKSTTGLTPEEARDVRARVWKFIFDRYREKAARTNGGEDEKKETNQ
jgi:hypothetical protein